MEQAWIFHNPQVYSLYVSIICWDSILNIQIETECHFVHPSTSGVVVVVKSFVKSYWNQWSDWLIKIHYYVT